MPSCSFTCALCGNVAVRPLLSVTSTLGDAYTFPTVKCCNGHGPVEMARALVQDERSAPIKVELLNRPVL